MAKYVGFLPKGATAAFSSSIHLSKAELQKIRYSCTMGFLLFDLEKGGDCHFAFSWFSYNILEQHIMFYTHHSLGDLEARLDEKTWI